MLTPAAALRRVLDRIADLAPLPAERMPLREAVGRALAEDLRAGRDLPSFDNSQMDGFALRAADAPRPGARLPVAFEIPAGITPPRSLPPGACARIFTGAPLPRGADCVEMQEEVERQAGFARFRRRAERGRFVRSAGADVARGAVALGRGTEIDPGSIGLAAALGHAELMVHRRPRVALLTTGDEIVPLGETPGPGQIFDSNSHALAAACSGAAAAASVLPLARDDRRSLEAALVAARGCDVLVTTGGVSVGEKDLVRAALVAAGAELDFWRVAMRPGKPVAFGRWERSVVFGLPGNPASVLVAFELFVRPALRALAGLAGSGRLHLQGRLSEAQDKPLELATYLRTRARWSRGELWLEPLATQQSGHLTSFVGVDALAVLPSGIARVRRGTRVEAIMLRCNTNPE